MIGETGGHVIVNDDGMIIADDAGTLGYQTVYIKLQRQKSTAIAAGDVFGNVDFKCQQSDGAVKYAGRISGREESAGALDIGSIVFSTGDQDGVIEKASIDGRFGVVSKDGKGFFVSSTTFSQSADQISAFGSVTGLQSSGSGYDVGGAHVVDLAHGGMQYRGVSDDGPAVTIDGRQEHTAVDADGCIKISSAARNGAGLTGISATAAAVSIFSNEDRIVTVYGDGKIHAAGFTGATVAANSVEAVTGLFKNITTTGSFVIGLTGISGSCTGLATYSKIGDIVTLYLPQLQAFSNSNEALLFGIPEAIRPPNSGYGNPQFPMLIRDVGVQALGQISIGDSTLWSLTNGVGNAYGAATWGVTGYKGTYATMLTYHIAATS
jgi:hypothetical protein